MPLSSLTRAKLPVELIEHIIDLLHSDPYALLQLALTCHALLPRSRYNLSSVIGFRPTVEDVDSLCNRLDTNPWLGPLIRVVVVYAPHRFRSAQSESFSNIFPPRLLQRLPHVRNWKLFIRPDEISEHRLPVSFHWTTLAFLKRTNSIHMLDLKNLQINSNIELARLVSSLPVLGVMRCSNITLRNMTVVVGLVHRRPHQSLRTLCCAGGVQISTFRLLVELSRSTIKYLQVGYSQIPLRGTYDGFGEQCLPDLDTLTMFDPNSKLGWEGAQMRTKKIMQKLYLPALNHLRLEVDGCMKLFNMVPAGDCKGVHPLPPCSCERQICAVSMLDSKPGSDDSLPGLYPTNVGESAFQPYSKNIQEYSSSASTPYPVNGRPGLNAIHLIYCVENLTTRELDTQSTFELDAYMNQEHLSGIEPDRGSSATLWEGHLVLKARSRRANSIPIPGIGGIITSLDSLMDKIMEMDRKHKGFHTILYGVLQLIHTFNMVMTKIERTIEEIPSTDPRRHALMEALRGSSKLKTDVTKLFNDIGELKAKADKLSSYEGSRWLRWIHRSRDEKIVEGILKAVANCTEYFKLEFQVAIEASMEEVLEKHSATTKDATAVKEVVVQVATNSYNREEKILEALPRADASYRAAINTTKGNFLPGTRVELFHALNQWAERRTPELSGKAICLLTGGMGTGKSTIASEFARRCNEQGEYGASFFFVRGVKDLDSTRLVFQTLAYQLAQSQDALRAHIVNAAHNHLKLERNSHWGAGHYGWALLYRPIQEISDRHPPMFIVIDALDECSDERRKPVPEMLVQLIHIVLKARFPLRIFFTSRPDSVIKNTLRQSQWASLVHEISLHNLSQESVQRDMAIFVRDRLGKFPSGQALLREWPKVVHRLEKRAGGRFLYAKLAIDFLSGNPSFVQDGLDELLSEDSSGFAGDLQSLDNFYLIILETTFPLNELFQVQPRQFRKALELTLSNIAVLRNPMSPAVLASLTDIPHEAITTVLHRLRSIVLYNADAEKPDDEKFCALHATFPQFLLDANRCKNMRYHVDPRRHHSRLAAGCLRALGDLEGNMGCLPDPTLLRTEIPDLAERFAQYIPKHVQYACVHWAEHLGGACEMQEKLSRSVQCDCYEIRERLRAFVRTKLGLWVEMMAYMGQLGMVTGMLDVALAYIKDAILYRDVDLLLKGARQLVVDHYSEIKEHPYTVSMSHSE